MDLGVGKEGQVANVSGKTLKWTGGRWIDQSNKFNTQGPALTGGSGGGGPQFFVGSGSPTSGPYGDYQNKLGGKLPSAAGGTSTTSGGGNSPAPPNYHRPSGPPPTSGGGTNSGALGGLQSLLSAPGGSGGMGMAGGGVGATSVPGVGSGMMSDMGTVTANSAPPTAPSGEMGLPGGGGGEQYLSGPMAGRQGLGQRMPPSLAGLLKPKVY